MCDILNRTLSEEESKRLKADPEYLILSNEVTVRALSASICRRAVAWHIALARALTPTLFCAYTFPHHLEQMSVAAEMMKEEICFWRQQARSSPPHAFAAGESAFAHAGTGYCTTRTPVSTHDASVAAASISAYNAPAAVAAPVSGRGAVPMTRGPVLEPDIDTPKRKEDTPAPSLDD